MNNNPYQSRDARGRLLPASHCHKGHPLEGDNIYLNTKNDGRVVRYCRTCRADSDRVSSQKIRKINRQKYYNILKASKCIDCGESRPAALHFDHVDPSTKSFTISDYLGKKIKWEKLYEEMAKCEIRCANCHSVRTAEQFGWYQDLD